MARFADLQRESELARLAVKLWRAGAREEVEGRLALFGVTVGEGETVLRALISKIRTVVD